ncbi:MAG: 2Fe-2S iron-sulfur cluster binding domain-containing protein [Proteobacteria bacterium]|nr:2Fe-2S iron-sulfur cluster binding domain-containing protein [Pseudomonadota bacterium]NIS67580.1 2Fe-2S iron-sulfur cluster binding domain-containing protein [Pseudomonadota bacterium]
MTLRVNGIERSVKVRSNRTLIQVIRYDLKLTGTKQGCGIGECGACTVLMDGEPVNSCLVMAPKAQKKDILTIEGLGGREKLHPLQKAFIDHGAVQCGFCTPGMLMATKALLDRTPNPAREEIKEALTGNLCRCTGYLQIIEAIEAAVRESIRYGS